MDQSGRVGAIVAAAGRGERLGPGAAKALRPIGGVPMFLYAVEALAWSSFVDLVVVAAAPAELPEVRAALTSHEFTADVQIVPGGDTRQESVACALAALPADIDAVLVHDAARPFVPTDVVDAVVATIRGGACAVVPVLPVVDTVKEVGTDDLVRSTLDRSSLRAVQTPQGFARDVLEQAHGKAEGDATDDAGLVERLGLPVTVVPGSEYAFKVTRPLDLLLAEGLVARQRADVRRADVLPRGATIPPSIPPE